MYKFYFPSDKVIEGLYFEGENNPDYLINHWLCIYTYKGQTLEEIFFRSARHSI